jgi:hypothetical protein
MTDELQANAALKLRRLLYIVKLKTVDVRFYILDEQMPVLVSLENRCAHVPRGHSGYNFVSLLYFASID